MQITHPLTVYIPDTRGVVLSRFGKGNLKIGLGVYTYSRLPGAPAEGGWPKYALGLNQDLLSTEEMGDRDLSGTCPGATAECQSICYAARPVAEHGPVFEMWLRNAGPHVPPIPADATLLRLHISGDFDTNAYITNWILRIQDRPDVTVWAYTRSWRVPTLLAALERLRALPNVQLFASMDKSTVETPPAGWRRAWIDGDPRAGEVVGARAHEDAIFDSNLVTFDGTFSYVCPEETKRKADCESCRYCFDGQSRDVTFLEH